MYLNRSSLNHPEDASYTGEFPHNQMCYSWKPSSLLMSRSWLCLLQLWKDGKKQDEVIGLYKAYLVVNDVRKMIELELTGEWLTIHFHPHPLIHLVVLKLIDSISQKYLCAYIHQYKEQGLAGPSCQVFVIAEIISLLSWVDDLTCMSNSWQYTHCEEVLFVRFTILSIPFLSIISDMQRPLFCVSRLI